MFEFLCANSVLSYQVKEKHAFKMFLFFSGSKTDIGFVLRALVSGFAEIFTKIGSWQGDVASFFLQRKKGDCEDNCEGTQERLHKKLGQ